MLDDWDLTDDALDGPLDPFYAQVIITVIDQAPLFASPRRARRALDALATSAPDAPGSLWGYLVLPGAIRFIVGPTGNAALDDYTAHIKSQVGARVLAAIHAADDGEALDIVLRYNPVRGGVQYQVWQAGSHRAIFWTEYKLSNAIYELQQVPGGPSRTGGELTRH